MELYSLRAVLNRSHLNKFSQDFYAASVWICRSVYTSFTTAYLSLISPTSSHQTWSFSSVKVVRIYTLRLLSLSIQRCPMYNYYYPFYYTYSITQEYSYRHQIFIDKIVSLRSTRLCLCSNCLFSTPLKINLCQCVGFVPSLTFEPLALHFIIVVYIYNTHIIYYT